MLFANFFRSSCSRLGRRPPEKMGLSLKGRSVNGLMPDTFCARVRSSRSQKICVCHGEMYKAERYYTALGLEGVVTPSLAAELLIKK